MKKSFLGGHAPRLPYMLHAYAYNIIHTPLPNLMYPPTPLQICGCEFVGVWVYVHTYVSSFAHVHVCEAYKEGLLFNL